MKSLPAWGVRVEISRRDSPEWIPRHSPHGECGLKYTPFDRKPVDRTSLPAWGVRVEIGSGTGIAAAPSSLPVWGVRVEIWPGSSAMAAPQSLPAWGVRVEILNASTRRSGSYRSLPAWGVRVEILFVCRGISSSWCHSPHGECGLKFAHDVVDYRFLRHSPHGECGLKSLSSL